MHLCDTLSTENKLYFINHVSAHHWIGLFCLISLVVAACYYINLKQQWLKKIRIAVATFAVLFVLTFNVPVLSAALNTPVRQWQTIEVQEQGASSTIAASIVKAAITFVVNLATK
ncbi:MAG: hypothetical protein RL660_2169 [Bacteroidota bacterium]